MKIESYRDLDAFLGGGVVIYSKKSRYVQRINYVFHCCTLPYRDELRYGLCGQLIVSVSHQERIETLPTLVILVSMVEGADVGPYRR